MRCLRSIPALVCCLALAACGGDASVKDRAHLVLTGSSTLAPLASEVAKRFESLHLDVRVDVQTGGSSRGMADARQGLADIGMVSRSPREGEDDLVWHPVAVDGISIIVHAENPVAELSADQVKSIFLGEIVNWSEVGGNDAPITVVNKAEGRSTLEVFLAHFGLESGDIQADVIIGDNQQGIKTVVANPDAIAYVSIGTAEYEANAGTAIRLVTLDGSKPSTAALRDGTYPVARTLHLVTTGEPEGWVATFIAFMRSAAVHDLVEGQYFVPLAG